MMLTTTMMESVVLKFPSLKLTINPYLTNRTTTTSSSTVRFMNNRTISTVSATSSILNQVDSRPVSLGHITRPDFPILHQVVWYNAHHVHLYLLMHRTKCFCIKLFSTNASTKRSPISNLVSHYFSLLDSSPNPISLRHLHGRLLRTSLYDNVILSSKLVLMYSQHNKLTPDSLSVFLHMPQRNIYSWNIIIGEFSRSGSPKKSIELFRHMQNSDVRPDSFTLPLVLRACACSGVTYCGILVHGFCVKIGVDKNLFVASALVFMYVTFGKGFDARVVFDEMPQRDSVLWTSMLAGYAQHEEPILALSLFREMVALGVELDGVVMVSLLLICGQMGWLKHGKSVHGWCLRRCLRVGLSLGNALTDMYVKCSALSFANSIFNGMPEKDVISWSALILGYGLGGCVETALSLFDQMLIKGVKPNSVTFLGVLSACAHGGMVERAQSYFKMMEGNGLVAELKHYACMVDCLGRRGLLEEAEIFIEQMPVEPDGAVLGALVGGCRLHGNFVVGERIAKRLIRLEPERAGYYVLLANIYADMGRFDAAESVREFMKQRNVSKLPGLSLIESKNSLKFSHQSEDFCCFEIG